MADRKHYSKRREDELYRIVHDVIMEVRISMLRGAYDAISGNYKEEKFSKQTAMLGDKVCAVYRKSYAKGKK